MNPCRPLRQSSRFAWFSARRTASSSPNPGLGNGGNAILGGAAALGAHDVRAVGTFDGPNAGQTLILPYTRP